MQRMSLCFPITDNSLAPTRQREDLAHTQISNPKVSLEGGQNAHRPTTSLEAVMKVEELLAVMHLLNL